MGSGNFARGFMEVYPKVVAMTEQRKSNAWEKMWDTWEKSEEQDRKSRQESAAIDRKANELINTYDVEGRLPEGASAVIASKIAAGFSDNEIKELIQKGTWGVTDIPAGQVNPADQREQQTVDQQTVDAMATEPSQMPVQQPQGILGTIVSKGKEFAQQIALSPEEKMLQKFAKEKGMTPDQVRQMMAGGTIQQIPSAQERWDKTSAGITVKAPLPNQSPLMDPADRAKAIQDAARDAKDIVKDVNEKRGIIVSMFRDANDLNKIVRSTEGYVLADATSNFAQFVSAVGQNVDAGLGLVTTNIIGDISGLNQNQVSTLANAKKNIRGIRQQVVDGKMSISAAATQTEQLIGVLEQSELGSNINNLAQARTLMEMKNQLLAYKIAMLYGQDNRNLAEGERIMFQQMAKAGNSEEKYYQNISLLLKGEVQRLEDTRGSIANNYTIATFKDAYGEEYPALDRLMGPSIEDAIKSDPEAAAAYEQFFGSGINNNNKQIIEEGYQYIGPAWKNPDEEKRLKGDKNNWKKVQ